MDHSRKKIALVTGATGGIGAEVSKQLAEKDYKVILAGQNDKKLDTVYHELTTRNLDVIPFKLDVTSEENIKNCVDFVLNYFGKLDVLINNAAVYFDNRVDGIYPDFFSLDGNFLKKTMEVNFYGPFYLSQLFLPIMQFNNYGRIVNVSSGMARFEDLDKRGPFYRMSKVSLNSLTCILASLCVDQDICINSVCPGWVRSQMGGDNAIRSPYEGALGIVWAATLPTGGPSGKFFRDGEPLDWNLKLGDPY
jgi:NAD(P)-dependent dehydrogenase (short-subunit alcohol dehydrogenase family)